MFTIRICSAIAATVLSCLSATAQTHIVAVSGSDKLALHNLATGEELTRFDTTQRRASSQQVFILINFKSLVQIC